MRDSCVNWVVGSTFAMVSIFGQLAVSDDKDVKKERLLNERWSEECGQSSECDGDKAGGCLRGLLEPIATRLPSNPDSSLFNEDFAPTMPADRIFTVWDMACLWIGLVIGVPTYYMAGSLVELGMSWWEGIVTVFIGNMVVLVPMVLIGHAGTKFGVPFPVLARASFGIRGANVPSLLRALVACGWFGIQTWIGGQAVFQLLNASLNGSLAGSVVPWLGISAAEFGCFMAFWLLQVRVAHQFQPSLSLKLCCIIWERNEIEAVQPCNYLLFDFPLPMLQS